MTTQPPAEPPRAKHTTSTYDAAQISPASYRPHAPGGVVTATVGVNPDPRADQQVAPDISPTVPYEGDSPTGYDPYTMGTF